MRPAAIRELAEMQKAMLARAAAWLKPGGTLVYSVCSIEPEEGEEQARAFLARHPDFSRIRVRADETGLDAMTGEGDLRTLPDGLSDLPDVRPGLDGFFALRVSRKAA